MPTKRLEKKKKICIIKPRRCAYGIQKQSKTEQRQGCLQPDRKKDEKNQRKPETVERRHQTVSIYEIFRKLNEILEKLDNIYHYLRGEEPPKDE